ncbi:hypothetical protein JD969_08760 [Planctomycetota bacterium]|nr:hypothetical protein JD969_08760 [Planctomycetota bacterium]
MMAVYLFTFHAYGSWMPDRDEGYVRSGGKFRDTDHLAYQNYLQLAKENDSWFGCDIQLLLLEVCRKSSDLMRLNLYGFSCDVSHVHVLVGWEDEREWEVLRNRIKYSMTSRLNNKYGKRKWFSKGASRKRVKDQEHFDYLCGAYLPKHDGVVWIRKNDCEE